MDSPTFDVDMSGATADELAGAQAAGEKAFADIFAENAPDFAPAFEKKDDPEEGKAAPAPGPAAAPAPEPAPSPAPAVQDPFAGIPEPVRNLLAEVPTLKHDLNTAIGRIGALQRELDKARASAAPAAPAAGPAEPPAEAPIEAVERVRGELPEVAEAIEESVKRALGKVAAAPAPAAPAAPAPAPSQQEADPELEALNGFDPEWGAKVHSTDFNLWMSTLPAEEQTRIRTTEKSAVLVGALTRFNKYQDGIREAVQAAQGAGERRSARAAAAVTPKGAPAPARAAPPTDEEAFEAGFRDG
jgi:hypothetical protein